MDEEKRIEFNLKIIGDSPISTFTLGGHTFTFHTFGLGRDGISNQEQPGTPCVFWSEKDAKTAEDIWAKKVQNYRFWGIPTYDKEGNVRKDQDGKTIWARSGVVDITIPGIDRQRQYEKPASEFVVWERKTPRVIEAPQQVVAKK